MICIKSILLQTKFDLISFEELVYSVLVPIEVNRVNKECPKCKNPTIFHTGKEYFCGKCLSELKINQVAEKITA